MERPLRSWMFVPGNRDRFLNKIYELEVPPDGVFFDLEDGVVPEEKGLARAMVAEALRQARPGPLRVVRTNAVESPWFSEDLEAILVPGLEGVCLPKVEKPETVRELASELDQFADDVPIVIAVESASGLLRAPELAAAHPRVLALMFGAEDYALDIGLGTQREREARELIWARSALVNAAAAARVLAIDGVFPALDDPEGLAADVMQARRLGFDAKSTFNPRQVALINEYFSPTPDELEYAQRVAEAFQAAAGRAEASVVVGGQLVDRPIVLRALRLLEFAKTLGLPTAEGNDG